MAFVPSVSTTYSVTGTDGNGCTNTSSSAITVNGALTVGVSATSSTVCSGSATTLTATGATTYSWMPGSLTGASVSVSPTTTTTYTVTVVDALGCSATDTALITINQLYPFRVQINFDIIV